MLQWAGVPRRPRTGRREQKVQQRARQPCVLLAGQPTTTAYCGRSPAAYKDSIHPP